MTESPRSLQDRLDTMVHLLGEGPFYVLGDEEKEGLLLEAQGLHKRLDSAKETPLTIGLLGGTGVGKSTLMNALAGARIASTSYRRPHTDHALIYRHEDGAGISPQDLEAVPWREITHHCDTIRHLLLCDLPDFDSLLGEHRDHVLAFLKHLDILVWVTSPEKYADRRFHEFLALVPKAQQNFYFVLNKSDLLFEGKSPEEGYGQLDSVIRQFLDHLKEKADMNDVIFYPVAAREVENGVDISPWNQFPSFRQQVFQQRDVKQIAAIKAANLDVEVDHLAASFGKEISALGALTDLLDRVTTDLDGQRERWREAAGRPIDLWVNRYIRKALFTVQADPSHLLGPGYIIARVFSGRGGDGGPASEYTASERYVPPKPVMDIFFDHHLLVLDRIDHLILRQRLPVSLRSIIRDLLDTKRQMTALKTRLSEYVSLRIAGHVSPSFRLFKFFQFGVYGLLFAFFLFALGGQSAWLKVLDEPGLPSAIRLVLVMVTSLFSAKGLAALGSYALLNLFAAFRFYRSYCRRLEKRSDAAVRGLKEGLSSIWENELDEIVAQLRAFQEETETQTQAVKEAAGK